MSRPGRVEGVDGNGQFGRVQDNLPRMYWFESSGSGRNRFAVFRRSLRVGTVPPSAALHVFADSLYRLIVNGRVAGYGPARFLPRFPQYDSYDLTRWIVPGDNEVTVEVNSRGAPSYQAVPGRGGLAVWGNCGDEDLGLPGKWIVEQSRQWHANTDAFSFAQGPLEVRDFRLPARIRRVPTEVEDQGHWGDFRARELPPPSLRVAEFRSALTVANLESGRYVAGFRCPPMPRGRLPFLTHLFSAEPQVVMARMNWGPVALNGRLVEPICKDGKMWEVMALECRAGWNFLCGLIENISHGWIWQIDFPGRYGIRCGLEPREESLPGFFLGPHSTDPGSLDDFLKSPAAEWDPANLHARYVPTGAGACLCPAREMDLDVVARLVNPTPPGGISVGPGQTMAVVWDFGGEYLGHPKVSFRGPAGTVVDFGYDERLDANGLIDFYRCNPFVNSADRFVLDGLPRDLETFHERGGRYFQATVRVPKGDEMAWIGTPAVRLTTIEPEIVGRFSSDDNVLNWVWRAGVETLGASMADGWIDPWRERGLYLGDALVQGRATRVVTRDWRMDSWALRLWARGQREDGQMPDVVPSHHEQPLNDYTLLWIVALRNYWSASGDDALVRELMPTIAKIFRSSVWREGMPGLWEVTPAMKLFIDWGVVPEERLGTNACLNAIRCHALECAAEMMVAVGGHQSEAEQLRHQQRQVVEALNRHLWLESEGRFAATMAGGRALGCPSLHANSLILAFGLCNGSRADRAMEYLLSGLRGDRMLAPGHCELYFLYYVLQALYRHERAGDAEELIRSHYGLMKHRGAWTFWERLDRGLEGLDSLCHGWSTGPLVFLSERVLGVRLLEAGKPGRILVAPQGETVNRASGSVPHPDGQIDVEWKVEDDGLFIDVAAPECVELLIAPEGRLAKLPVRVVRRASPAKRGDADDVSASRRFASPGVAILVALIAFISNICAHPFLHPVFTTDMVIQRDAVVPVWGWTTPGASVQVNFAGGIAGATADLSGKWRVDIGPFPAGGPHDMQITGPTTATLSNVMVGDIWLCLGQSNMERDMSDANLLNAAAERADSISYPNIRHFKVQSGAAQGAVARTPQDVLPAGSGPWRIASPATTGGFSAVGYFMARALHQHNGIAMGILNASKGSCRHAPWMSREAAETLPDFTEELFNLDTSVINDLETVCVRHNAMVAPLVGFPIRGIVWYQGESSTGLADQYQRALPAMLADWRAKFGANLPVVVIQLSTYAGWSTVPVRVFDTWPIIREAQLQTAAADPRTALVCTLDAGDAVAPADIHPINKQDVGRRAARALRQLSYGEPIDGQGPLFSHAALEGASMRCFFTNVGEGLMVGDKLPNDATPVSSAPAGTALFGFALSSKANASTEADWKAASAVIDSVTNTVIVESPEVSSPVHVRYAWATNPHHFGSGQACNLYSRVTDGNGTVVDGLPASPFRSDSKAWLRVNAGTGSTTVTVPRVPGTSVSITAGSAPPGQVFAGWSGDTSALGNATAASTTALLAAGYTSVRALYRFLSPPSGLAVAIYEGEASMSWTPVGGARYTVYRSENGGPALAIATGLAGANFSDPTITAGVSYSYSVSADLPGLGGVTSSNLKALPFVLGGFSVGASGAEIRIATVVGRQYRVERSEDLVSWTTVADNIVGNGSEQTIADPLPSLPPRLFYRAVSWPAL